MGKFETAAAAIRAQIERRADVTGDGRLTKADVEKAIVAARGLIEEEAKTHPLATVIATAAVAATMSGLLVIAYFKLFGC
jgi:hypothetical protein